MHTHSMARARSMRHHARHTHSMTHTRSSSATLVATIIGDLSRMTRTRTTGRTCEQRARAHAGTCEQNFFGKSSVTESSSVSDSSVGKSGVTRRARARVCVRTRAGADRMRAVHVVPTMEEQTTPTALVHGVPAGLLQASEEPHPTKSSRLPSCSTSVRYRAHGSRRVWTRAMLSGRAYGT